MSDEKTSALIPRDSITEIVAYRNAAVALYEDFFTAIERAHKTLANAEKAVRLACGGEFGHPYADATEVRAFMDAVKPPNIASHKRVARRLTDIQVWGAVIQRTELETLMDKTAKDELRAQMAYIPENVDRRTGQVINAEEIERSLPPVTEEAILETLDKFKEDAGEIWRRGIAEAFSKLDRRFRSHDGFKVGARMILTDAFDAYGWWNHYAHHQDTLLDIERVFLVLDGKLGEIREDRKDGKQTRAAYGGITGKIQAERGRGGASRQSVHCGDYFRVRIFKNGNAHLWFERPDLVEKVNKLLAEYYGAALGYGKNGESEDVEAPLSGAMERKAARNFGLFPTPDKLADQVIEAAHLTSRDRRPLTILEPSAGTGQLAKRAADFQYWGTEGELHRVTCVEIQPKLATALAAGPYARVIPRDFLKMEPNGERFDRIIMNPPFDRSRDIDHVNHALGFLKPGGRLVAIMSASAEFSESRKAIAFRAKVDKLAGPRPYASSSRSGATWTDLPAGSFKEAGTSINAVMLSFSTKKGTTP